MVDVETTKDGRSVVVRMSGMITEKEIDACSERVAASINVTAVKTILLDWTALEGWEKGAKSVGTWFGMRTWAGIQRVAIVAEAKWEDETLRIADIYKVANVQRFAPEQRAEAMAWLDHT